MILEKQKQIQEAKLDTLGDVLIKGSLGSRAKDKMAATARSQGGAGWPKGVPYSQRYTVQGNAMNATKAITL